MYQPHTTDVTPDGLRRARNATRLRLRADDALAHRFLCHPDRECTDGCDDPPHPARLALYTTDVE